MKTKINKSQLFKMAWSMYKRSISVLGREFCQSFSACLRNAWFKMKAEARKAEKEARRLMKKSGPAQKPESIVFDSAMERGIIEYYRNQSGRYCGDWYTKYTCSSKTTRAVARLYHCGNKSRVTLIKTNRLTLLSVILHFIHISFQVTKS